MTAILEKPKAGRAAGRAARETALAELLVQLKVEGYRFIVPTPATHRRVLSRPDKAVARSIRDVFGWSLPFHEDTLPPMLLNLLRAAGVLEATPEGLKATVRVASLGGDLFLHSAFPPAEDDAVFFGPDTYRFANFITAELASGPPPCLVVDIGAGSGAGGVVAAHLIHPKTLILTDVNRKAIGFARINLRAAGLNADFRLSDGLDAIAERPDLIVANPPFIAGDGGRTYRDGGDMHGTRLSLDWALAGAAKLAPGGRLLLYTGAAIVEGDDALQDALEARLDRQTFSLAYRELDPDIFGGQLRANAYADVERIAAIGAVISRRG